jgi:hypothetical protein
VKENEMNDNEIINFIKELEEYVPKEGAEAIFVAFGEVAFYANKSGYLRMSIELMKCAFEETYPEADLNYLFGKDSEFGIDHLTINKEQLDFFRR